MGVLLVRVWEVFNCVLLLSSTLSCVLCREGAVGINSDRLVFELQSQSITNKHNLWASWVRQIKKLPYGPMAALLLLCAAHLTNARTVSEDSAGEGAITTSASPSSTSSHSIWMWKKTGWKHLGGAGGGVRERERDTRVRRQSGASVPAVPKSAQQVATQAERGSHRKRSTSWMVGSTMDTWLSLWNRQTRN